MLPAFVDSYYQLAWWIMTAIYVLIAVVVAILGGPGRLVTTIPRDKYRTGVRNGPPSAISRAGGCESAAQTLNHPGPTRVGITLPDCSTSTPCPL